LGSVGGPTFSAPASPPPAARLAGLPPQTRPRLLRASLDAFNPARVRFGAVLAFEVLEHVADDKGLLNQVYELLAPGGWMLVSVPAHQRLFSAVDASVGHFRRYERDELHERFLEAGFEVDSIWCYGFPLANVLDAVRRRITMPAEPGSPEALAMRSAESGNTIPARSIVKLLVRPATMLPFIAMQRLFLNGDRGPGYIVLARKPIGPYTAIADDAFPPGSSGRP
jgi:SAM-dependent methyltransferase